MEVIGIQQTTTKISYPTQNKKEIVSKVNNLKTENIYKKLSSKHNVRNISPPDMRELANELYDNGKIGLNTLWTLTMVPIETYETPFGVGYRPVQSREQSYDYISNLEGAIAFAKQHGSDASDFEKALSVLKKVDMKKHGPNVNIDI